LWDEAGNISRTRQEARERTDERLLKLENDIKEGKIKKAVETVGGIFASTVK
jgi:hypothetical protein